MVPSQNEILKAIHNSGISIGEEGALVAARFGEILYQENESQNLTRIIGASEFVEGHLQDVLALLSLPALGKRILDIGSGSGIPGLLGAALSSRTDQVWFLTESEGKKAEYLERARAELGLDRVSVLPKRVEDVVELVRPDTIIARAVGNVEKIANWIWECSTWNNLVLFKSKGWDKEWSDAQRTRFGKKLTVIQTHDYSTAEKSRVLVTLKRK
jgi:16S rRNA (guanine(527)-N(7))-methyltransferase RsmG